MKNLILLLLLNSIFCSLFSQIENNDNVFNFGFERISKKETLPDNWFKWGKDYFLKVDSVEKHSGTYSLLIEPMDNKGNNSFGCCAYSIPADYAGTHIELKAYMKLQSVTNGPIGLLLRIDGDEGILKFDNMQKDNVQGTSDWTLYSVKLPLPENAQKIYIGALLSGTGKLWVDDFQLLIDGEDVRKAKLKKQAVFKADNDKEFDNGSLITSIQLTPDITKNLLILGKVWGFLKYYHSSIGNGDYNWDYELFRILPPIINCRNYNERNEILSKWIDNLGEIQNDTANEINTFEIKLKPDLDWINDNSKLGEKLCKQLIQVKNGKHSGKNYYVRLAPKVGNPLFEKEKSYANFVNPDAGFRLLALYRYWNIIQYFYPYRNLIDKNWDDVLMHFIPKFINDTNELDYKLTTLALIANVGDTHANIWGNDSTLLKYKGNNYAPVEIKFVENKAVISGSYNKKYVEKTGLKNGDVILYINNKSISKIIEEKLLITPASNYPTQLRDIARDLLRTNDTIIDVTYKRSNSTKRVKIKCYPPKELDIYHLNQKDTCFKLLTYDIAYLYPGSIKNSYLPKIMPEINKSKGLIIDMRCYPNEFIVYSLGEFLFPDTTSFVKITNGSIESPGLFTFARNNKVGKSNKKYYNGKIVIIVNEITQSQAEYTTMAFRASSRSIVIGSTTAGADGNLSGFNLPGGIRTAISGIGIYYPDGKETQRIGIIPDIELKPTIKGISENRDELLEKAIEIIKEQ